MEQSNDQRMFNDLSTKAKTYVYISYLKKNFVLDFL